LADVLRQTFDRRFTEWSLRDSFKNPTLIGGRVEEYIDGPVEELEIPAPTDLET